MTINLAAIESRNEERRRLRDAATQGPWDSIGGCKDDAPPHCCRYVGPAAAGPVLWAYGTNRSANINLAAYARTDTAPEDIAALLAEVRRLEGELKEEQDRSSDIGCYAASLRTEMRRVSERMNEILGE